MSVLQPQLLSNQVLAALPANIGVPSYDRTRLKTGIVHVGVGGFHRSHQGFYTDNYMSQTGDLQWGICGVGLREHDRKMQQLLAKQDYLYSLLVKQPSGEASVQVIGCMTDFLLGCDDAEAVIEKMAADDTKIVSLTITEGGYNFNPATGEFDLTHPDVQHDLANPTQPRLVFGFLAAALKRRKDSGRKPFTIQSCDNIQHNGKVARNVLVTYIKALDPELAVWVEENVAFPNAMVDRITPATTPADIARVADAGIIDAWPVTCEPFHQWVIEDNFSDERPKWEILGAQFVPDVTPYETMKIRLLNASHTVLGMLGSLQGYQTIDESIQDPLFARFVRQFMDDEVTPILAPVEGIDLNNYKATLIERFANPNIKDGLSRICSESSSKVATFLVPTICENLANGGDIKGATLVVAAWCYYSDTHSSQQGQALEVIDVMADSLQQLAKSSQDDPLAFIRQPSIFANLLENERFTALYVDFIKQLYGKVGIKTIMQSLLNGSSAMNIDSKVEAL
jgi:mannitol 2-dehydrogenase